MYTTCDACSRKRNTLIAPECPICKYGDGFGKHSEGSRHYKKTGYAKRALSPTRSR